ncbi:MAG: hypothetical protein H8M99_00500 [Gloeobacteraceae cyanobacterium ES-bin-144]|nr:hypothetical protein [Verrucomicrobiales bacterium]
MSEQSDFIQPRGPLIEAAVKPLADNLELQLAAAGFLESQKTSDRGEVSAIMRWHQVDSKTRRSRWRFFPWVLLIVVSLAVWLADVSEIIARYQFWQNVTAFGGEWQPSVERVSKRLNPQQQLLMFGDLRESDRDERKKALWLSEPENPAYYADFVAAYVRENSGLPPDFLETAQRLAPQNAWFTYYAAAFEAKGAGLTAHSNSKKIDGKIVSVTPTWKIGDQASLNRSLELLRKAREQTKCDSYSAEMLRKRVALLRQRTPAEFLDSISVLSSTSDFTIIQIVNIGKAIAAKAWSLGEANDASGFLELSHDAESFLRGTFSMEGGVLLEEVVNSSVLRTIAGNFAPAAEKLKLHDEAVRWKAIDRRMEERQAFFKRWAATHSLKKSAGILFSDLETKWTEKPLMLTDADLKPGRLIDHEFFSRFFCYVIWIMMGITLGLVAIYRLRVSIMVRRLAARMEDLMRPMDWGWILGLGVILPFLYVMAINRLTPLGGRHFGLLGMQFFLPGVHFLGLILLWWIAPLFVTRWRLAKHAACFGFANSSWGCWVVLLCLVAFVPMAGWVVIANEQSGMIDWVSSSNTSALPSIRIWVSAGLLVIPMLWLLFSACRAIFGSAARQFHSASVSRLVFKAYAVSMLVAILSSVVFKAAEQYWFERETLMKIDPSVPAWTRNEYQISTQLRRELREILGFEP